MRVVGLIFTAALLLASASAHGQSPDPEAMPSLAPPQDVQGSWVSDQSETPQVTPPTSVQGSWVSDEAPTDASIQDGSFQYMGEADCYGDVDAGGCTSGQHSQLWSEVHDCRRIFGGADFLLWSRKGNQLPPLVTTSPIGTPQDQAGVLPESATTEILFGNQVVDDGVSGGVHLNAGYWIVEGQFLGIEADFWGVGDLSTRFRESSTFSDGSLTDPILARPFFNVVTGLQDSALVAFPDFVFGESLIDIDGDVNVRTNSEVVAAGLQLRKLLWIDFDRNYRVDILGGYRYFRAADSVQIDDSFTLMGGPFAQTTFESTDLFKAENVFHGGTVGFSAEVFRGRWSLEIVSKLGVGNNEQRVQISGSNSISSLGTTVTTPGGLLAQPTNIGDHRLNEFSVLPEGLIKLRYDWRANVRATIGYSFFYLDNAVSSGRSIDLGLNPTQLNGGTLAGEARPSFQFEQSSFWVQGLTAGLEVRY